MDINPVAHFHSPFTSKFGIPKQSCLVEELEGYIEFEEKFRNPDYLRGIEGFDYLWLVWQFSANPHAANSPLVRPPLLGGNEKVGVFASRSPFRPNAIGLSSVRLLRVEWQTNRGPLVYVGGADLMDGTPIFDIKPYVTFVDSHTKARSGFVDENALRRLKVEMPDEFRRRFAPEQYASLVKALELDPRPHYHSDSQKQYGMPFMEYDVRFVVSGNILKVTELKKY